MTQIATVIAALSLIQAHGHRPATAARAAAVSSSVVRLAPVGQEALRSGQPVSMTVKLRQRLRARVRVELAAGARRVMIGRPRLLVLRAGALRTIRFVPGAGARRAVAGCKQWRVVATVVSAGTPHSPPRSVKRPLELDPPRCARFFGARSIWNTPIPRNASLDSSGGAVIPAFTQEVDREYRDGHPPNINTTAYSAPIYTVAHTQHLVRVTLDQARGIAPALAQRFAAVPIPAGARPAAGTDSQMVVWQPSRNLLWEFWVMHREGDGWHARWGGRLDQVSRGPGYFTHPFESWGATATSLPLAGGMMTPAELRRGRIPHALAMTVPRTRAGLFAIPAQRTDGTSRSQAAIPEGARLRLDPKLDLRPLHLPLPLRAMAEAAQRYGIIVRDQAANVAFYGEDPTPSGSDPYPRLFGGQSANALLRLFPWRSLQLVHMRVRSAPHPGGGPLPCLLIVCP